MAVGPVEPHSNEGGKTLAATETPAEFKLVWNPGNGRDFFRRADGAEYSTAIGHRGTYEWVVKDGLHSAYHYPHGSHTPVVLQPPQRSWRRAYQACIEHNKEGVV